MFESDFILNLVSQQEDCGAFPSTVHLPVGKVADGNVFVTALVLDFLADYRHLSFVNKATKKALHFILSAESTKLAGHFRFYPTNRHPSWLNETLEFDIDDSALCTRVLYEYGIWSQDKLCEIIRSLSQDYALKNKPEGADWFRAGVYPTWLDRARLHNPIDLIANLNMAHLIHISPCDNTLYAPIVEMAKVAIACLEKPVELKCISPYYVNSNELLHVFERCIATGIPGIESLRVQFLNLSNFDVSSSQETPICCSYGNKVYWSSSILFDIRNFS